MFIEVTFQTFYKNLLGMYLSPLVWMAGGILVAIAGFYFSTCSDKNRYIVGIGDSKFNPVVATLVLCGIALYVGLEFNQLFEKTPIIAKESDIIPSIQMYVKRLLSGEVVYRPLPFEGYSVDPTYFPLLWLPYVFSELLEIDYRWIPYGVFLVALILYQNRIRRSDISLIEWLIKIIIPFGWLLLILKFDHTQFKLAVELVPVGYYLLLTLSILNKRPFIVAIGVLLCLLSRYAFTFWLPVYIIIYWNEYNFRRAFTASAYVVLGVLFIYIIPFLSKDWTVFSKGLQYYEKTAIGEWKVKEWQHPDEKPFYLKQGLSLAIYFYDNQSYKIEDRLLRNRKAHAGICALTAFLILIAYFLFSKKIKDKKLYLFAALKLYLVVFYGFFYVPFNYLYQLPLFMSIPILYGIKMTKNRLV